MYIRWISLALALTAPLIAAQPARILIVTGQSDIQYHDWRSTTPFWRNLLESTGRFEVRVTEEPQGLTPQALAGYDAVLLNYNGPRWGARAEAAVEAFVRSGKGLISFHGVTYGPLMGTIQGPGGAWTRTTAWPRLAGMLGVSWRPENIGHAPRHAFQVRLPDSGHPIAHGMAAPFTVNDELYHRMDRRAGIRVVATAFDDQARGGSGKDEPVAWTASYGKGRSFHCTLGHDTNALYNPPVMVLLARGAEWAATGEVTIPPDALPAAIAKEAVRVLVVTGGHTYDPSFYGVFSGYPDIRWSHATSQKEAFAANMQKRYDVVVLYDMYNEIGDAEKANLRAYVEAGKGVVALHHAIVDYTSWPWWHEEVIGGKYFEKPEGAHTASRYKDGMPIVARPVAGKENHPIVRGLGELVTVDECYQGMWHSGKITVLMETDSPCNDIPVVYIGPQPGSHAVYIQLGHEPYTHEHPGYRKLVRNAILWAAGR